MQSLSTLHFCRSTLPLSVALATLAVAGCGGSGGSGTTTQSASIHVVGTDPTDGTVTMDFTGAATQESDPGVYCKLYEAAAQPYLVVYGNLPSSQSSVTLKLWDFSMQAGDTRQETFSATTNTVDIDATLVTPSAGFGYVDASTDTTGVGSCTTTITALTAAAVAGTFVCDALPNAANDTLSMTFSCPLQP